jgi:hypothetical protein
MFCLLVVIFIILWSYKGSILFYNETLKYIYIGRSLTLNRDMKMSNIDIMDGSKYN